MTIASDDEIEPEEDSDSESEVAAAAAKPAPLTKSGKKRQRQKAAAAGAGAGKGRKGDGLVDPSFCFEVESNLGIAERQAVRGWDFKSEFSLLRSSCRLPPLLPLH